eukprot:3505810-Rhodomonas_salina.2
MGILSGHNVTLGLIRTGNVHLGAGAVMHPFSALFIGSVGKGSTILPRSKPLREMHIREHQASAWPSLPWCRDATTATPTDMVPANGAPALGRGAGRRVPPETTASPGRRQLGALANVHLSMTSLEESSQAIQQDLR